MAEGRMSRTSRFFKEVGVEMQKVTWPSKQELIGSTTVVLIGSVLLTAFVSVIDFGMKWLVEAFLRLGG